MGFMEAPKAAGDFKVYVNYNSKAGRWYTKADEKDAQLFEVTNLTAIFDIENIKTGWILFAAGQAPIKNFDPSLTQAAPKPEGNFKRGFELDLYSEKNLLGLREFSSTAGCVIEAMNALYDQWMAARGANPGKLPVVKCAGVLPITGTNGTNYQPQFEIVGWADRPDGMPANNAPVAPTPAPAAAAPVAKAQHVPPPAPAPAPAAVSSGDTDF